MVLNNYYPLQERTPSLSLGLGFVILTLFLIVSPFIAGGVVYFLADSFPKFEEETVVVDQDENQATSAPDVVLETLAEKDCDDSPETSPDDDSIFAPDQVAKQHPLARLLIRSRATPYFGIVAALFFLTVACLAPLAEEFVFRAVLQGTTRQIFDVDKPIPNPGAPDVPISSSELSPDETKQFHAVDRIAKRDRLVRVALAILFPALLFALLHAGVPDDPENPTPLAELFRSLVSDGLSNLTTFVVGLAFLVGYAGIKPADLGLPSAATLQETGRFLKSWLRGVFLLLLGYPVIQAINIISERFFPDAIVAPIPIFVFALYLGIVYYRSKEFATVLGMHMTLNFISFITLMTLVLKETA